jgi:LacI family fructose operon transcriptional repressor
VSIATVSRVLSGRTVAADLHERVQAAVLAVGYRPNLAARRLRSRHTNTIGLIVADIRNPSSPPSRAWSRTSPMNAASG